MRVMKAAAAKAQDSMSRPLGGRFANDRVEELGFGDSPLGGRLDAQGIGMAGQSFRCRWAVRRRFLTPSNTPVPAAEGNKGAANASQVTTHFGTPAEGT